MISLLAKSLLSNQINDLTVDLNEKKDVQQVNSNKPIENEKLTV